MLRQRLLLEEYGCTLKYIEGDKNVVANMLSRLDFEASPENVCKLHLMKYTHNDMIKVPVDLNFIAEQQQKDKEFSAMKDKCPERFKNAVIGNYVKI